MRAGRFVGGVLMTLMLAGCGGAQPGDAVEDSELMSREDDAPNCQGQGYEIEYYSDATYTTLVGTRGCDCGIWARWGVVTAYSQSYSWACMAR